MDKKEERTMKKLNNEQLNSIQGGASFSSAALNAVIRTVSTLFSIGQAVGSAIRRAGSRNYC